MNIKHGDIITLNNGDRAKINLEVINEKVTKLIPGEVYKLRYNGEHCHTYNLSTNRYLNVEEIGEIESQYVGTCVNNSVGERHIFINMRGPVYSMWGTLNLDFVVKQIKSI